MTWQKSIQMIEIHTLLVVSNFQGYQKALISENVNGDVCKIRETMAN